MKQKSLLLIFLLFMQGYSMACDCNPEGDHLEFLGSAIVQTSKIQSFRKEKNGEWKIKLQSVFCHKGTETNEVYIHSEEQSSSCAFNLKKGETWLFFIVTDIRKGKNYMLSCSGSRNLKEDERFLRFDSTLIYDTTIVRMGNFLWFQMLMNLEESELQGLLDSCSRSLKIGQKRVITLYLSRHGTIRCDTTQIRKVEPELIRQIDAFFEDKKIKPFTVYDTNVNVQLVVNLKAFPAEPD